LKDPHQAILGTESIANGLKRTFRQPLELPAHIPDGLSGGIGSNNPSNIRLISCFLPCDPPGIFASSLEVFDTFRPTKTLSSMIPIVRKNRTIAIPNFVFLNHEALARA
jgi:hypothetical protein